MASLVLGLIVLVRREPLPLAPRPPGARCFVGVLWFGLYNVALNEAERRVDAGTAAMLVNVGPILIAILAGLVLHEGFPRLAVHGLRGRVHRRGDRRPGHLRRRLTASWGSALCLVAAVSYAVAVVAQKPVLARVSALR